MFTTTTAPVPGALLGSHSGRVLDGAMLFDHSEPVLDGARAVAAR